MSKLSAGAYLASIAALQRCIEDVPEEVYTGFDSVELLSGWQCIIGQSDEFKAAILSHIDDRGYEDLYQLVGDLEALFDVDYLECSYTEHDWFKH